jgi:hypothetical protein
MGWTVTDNSRPPPLALVVVATAAGETARDVVVPGRVADAGSGAALADPVGETLLGGVVWDVGSGVLPAGELDAGGAVGDSVADTSGVVSGLLVDPDSDGSATPTETLPLPLFDAGTPASPPAVGRPPRANTARITAAAAADPAAGHMRRRRRPAGWIGRTVPNVRSGPAPPVRALMI